MASVDIVGGPCQNYQRHDRYSGQTSWSNEHHGYIDNNTAKKLRRSYDVIVLRGVPTSYVDFYRC